MCKYFSRTKKKYMYIYNKNVFYFPNHFPGSFSAIIFIIFFSQLFSLELK